MRDKRRKEQELKKLRDEIKANIIDKAEARDHVNTIEILDINGQYERNRPFLGAVGGHIMQLIMPLQGLHFVSQQELFQ